jgi:hypothetical protein
MRSCPRLTPRENDGRNRLARGLGDREIANRLVIGVETAHTDSQRL